MVNNTQLLNSYRVLLRHLRSLPSTKDRGSKLRQVFEDKFKDATLNKALLMDYARLITSVNEAARLRNLDSGETMDPSEKIKAMAARVGLGLPKEYVDEEANKDVR